MPAFAFLLGFIPAWFNLHGLGYVYIGRAKWALSLVLGLWLLLFALAWTRLVLLPGAIYIGPLVALILLIVVPIHAPSLSTIILAQRANATTVGGFISAGS